MKRLFSLFIMSLMSVVALAGGIVTNTNQSCSWVRLPVRDASTDIDAVYFNPAGLTQLEDGFYVYLSNQVLSQTREINNAYPLLNDAAYQGDVFAPLFPNAYLAFKKGKFAVGGGFMVIGGGGGAEYDKGLPSFEISVANIPEMLKASGIESNDLNNKYSANINFKGTSAYFGGQVNAAYAINDMISVAAGVRYVSVSNTYEGYIHDIMINPKHPINTSGQLMLASSFFTAAAASASSAANGLNQLVTGVGGLTLDQALNLSKPPITKAQADQISGGLGKSYNPAMTISQIQIAYNQTALKMNATALATGNVDVDAEQTATGITPFFGVHLALLEKKLNIGLKYEMKTEMDVENATTIDGSGLFPDGEKTASDMPAMLSVGVNYQITDKLTAYSGYHYYWDKNVSYGKKINAVEVLNDEVLDENMYELALGLSYGITEKVLVSAGCMRGVSSPNDYYQSDLSHSLKSLTVGFGGSVKLMPQLTAELGFALVTYDDREKLIDYTATGINDVKEAYGRKASIISFGLSYRFGGK